MKKGTSRIADRTPGKAGTTVSKFIPKPGKVLKTCKAVLLIVN